MLNYHPNNIITSVSGNEEAITSGSAIESSLWLQSCISSLLKVVNEKEVEIKTLQKRVESLHDSYHAEKFERMRLEYMIQSMCKTQFMEAMHAPDRPPPHECGAAMAQKNPAWSYRSQSVASGKYLDAIQAFQLANADELEKLPRANHSKAASLTTGVRIGRATGPGTLVGTTEGCIQHPSFPARVTNDDTVPVHRTVADDDDDDDPTAVSSTFGEGQERVIGKVLADSDSSRGVYTGIILSTTGMPHGAGRMLYGVVGRTYAGEWRHGRW